MSDKNVYYVDKTDLISETMNEQFILYTRPRKFGKTLNMSMLYYFFSNKEKENAYLFDGLNISKNLEVMKHQNQYPVIFMTLNDTKNKIFWWSNICIWIFNWEKFESVLDDSFINNREKSILMKYHHHTASINELKESLLNISYFNHPFIILNFFFMTI